MFVLLPCYSLEDFSLYRKSSEVDEIFSAWSALYHPALISRFDAAPRWEPAGSPASGLTRRLVVVPPCAEGQVPKSWLRSAEADGALVVRGIADRDEIWKFAFEKLEIETPQDEAFADAAESFASVGLCCLLEELLTRKLRYMSNLDTQSFNSRLVEAAKAQAAGNADERELNLQKAFDLLAQAKEYFFPTATKFLDLTWVEEEDFADALPAQLRARSRRDEKTNLVLPVPLLKICRDRYPETFALLKEEVSAKRVVLIGGDEWESPLYLMSPLEIAQTLIAGRDEYLNSFGIAPQIFARQEAGYAQILPQLLKLSGYRAAFARTGDGWSLLEKPSDRSQFRWTGRDGSTIATFCKKTLDAAESEEILQLPDRIGNSYYSDAATSIVFESRPGKASRWLSDLFRMSRYSPVLGSFYDFNEYFRVTDGSGDKEKFVKDNFKTNFLTRSAKKERADLVSIWPRRQRLGRLATALGGLETSVRLLTLKTKRAADGSLDALFSEYLSRSAALSERLDAALDRLDARYLASNPDDSTPETPDFDELFADFNRETAAVADAASRFLAAALKSAEPNESAGFLFVNPASTPQTVRWETRRLPENSATSADSPAANGSPTAQNSAKKAVSSAPSNAKNQTVRQESTSNVKIRSFASPDAPETRRFTATLPPLGTFWIRRAPNLEYRFASRPPFETGELDNFPENVAPTDENSPETPAPDASASAKSVNSAQSAPRKGSFFQNFATKLRTAVAVSPRNSAETAANGDGDAANRSRLAEYVEKRYSAKEIERYYSLRNEHFEIKIDPTTGSVRRLTTFNVETNFASNGVLRHPNRGNRFAWDFALRLPNSLRKEDFRPDTDSFYGYTTPAADKITALSSGPATGKIRIDGRAMAPNGEVAATFTQILTIRRESRIIEVEAEITPKIAPEGGPWESYFGCRFAWKDGLADLLGGVGATLIWTGRDYLQAPECVDVRSEPKIGITVLSAGLPYFKRISDTRLDAILIPPGETKRRFRFGIGVDLDDPQRDAAAFADVAPFVLPDVPRPKRLASPPFASSEENVQILDWRPLFDKPRDANAAARLNGEFVGVRLVLLETKSAATETTIKSILPLERVESLDFTGEILSEKIDLTNVSAFELKFAPRQIRVLNLYFRRSSLG